jgi:hypothetical protein
MMSDGERVAFYLLGQVLCAPRGAIIVVDEQGRTVKAARCQWP